MLATGIFGLLVSGQTLPPIFLPGQTVLFQGDSITDGNRGRSADPNHILGHGYAFSIASQYGAAFASLNLNFVNRGISGNTVADLEARWATDTVDLKPDVLSILVGINDIAHARWDKKPFDVSKFERTYDQVLAKTVADRPNVRLILGEPFVLDVGMVEKDAPDWHRDVRSVCDVVQRLANKYGAAVAHFQRAFDAATKRAPVNHWIWDGIHPTYSGHQIMAEEWIRAFNERFVPALYDPARNSAIAPQVNFERDSYDWLHRHADVLDAQRNAHPDVVLIGDSITHFWGGKPSTGQVNGPKSWNATFAGVNVINMGFGWDRTQNVLWRLEHGEFAGISPRSVILNIGTNNLVGDDTARTNSPEEVAVGITQIVQALSHRSPSSQIYVVGVFPRGFDIGNPLDQSITKLNSILEPSLRRFKNVRFLDIGKRLREPDGSISHKIFSDGTHPTDAGYEIWGQALREAGALRNQTVDGSLI